MKKLVLVILAAVLALIACAAAFANDTAVELYDGATTLLFKQSSLTLNATAEFSLDDSWFKTAEIVLKEDGNRSFRKLHLRSPKADGTERENGYTIVTEGNDLYLMEDFTPGICRTGVIADERSSVLRNTVQTRQMTDLGRALASQADLLLGKDAISRAEDGTIRIVLGDDAPGTVNALMNQGFQFAAKRYFGVDYDAIGAGRIYASLYDFGTLTQGILYSMRNVSLRQADITVKQGESGYPVHAEGTVGLYLETADDGIKQLNIRFTADVTDIGSTTLKRFDPNDYQVELAEDAYDSAYGEEYQPVNDEALKDQMMMDAMQIWENTGFNMVATTSVSCEWDGSYYEVSFTGGKDGVRKTAYYNETGEFRFLQAEPVDWMLTTEENIEYNLAPSLDAETDQKAQAFFMEFLSNIHYDQIDQVTNLQLQWTYEKDGNLYASYEDRSDHGDGEGVNFVIRISPEMRIESFFREVNG